MVNFVRMLILNNSRQNCHTSAMETPIVQIYFVIHVEFIVPVIIFSKPCCHIPHFGGTIDFCQKVDSIVFKRILWLRSWYVRMGVFMSRTPVQGFTYPMPVCLVLGSNQSCASFVIWPFKTLGETRP